MLIEAIEPRLMLAAAPADAAALDAFASQLAPAAIRAPAPASVAAKAAVKAQFDDFAQSPFRRNSVTLPKRIQVEDFDRGGQGVAYSDTTPGNQGRAYRPSESVDIYASPDANGGYYVGKVAAKEWLEYSIMVPAAGMYDLYVSVASAGIGGRFHIELDRVKKTNILTVPNTGGWQNWQTIVRENVPLEAGLHILRVTFDSANARGYVGNFDWIQLIMTTPQPPSDLVATVESAFNIRLTWSDNSSNETAFRIERLTAGSGTWQQIATVGADETEYLDTGLEPGAAYSYRVCASNPAGDSAFSLPASATTETAGPIVITSGGVYSGNWQSLNPDVAAVTIVTNQPVVIQDSTIRSKGTLIEAIGTAIDITVLRTSGYGMNPDVYGQHAGRFLVAEGFVNVVVENCYMEGTAGIYLYDYRGNSTESQTVKILRNRVRNIDGRLSDGNGGYLSWSDESDYVQFVQLNQAWNLRGAEIAWNEVVNTPGVSLVEDNISIYASSGTPSSPLLIHDNYIQGAYPLDPANDADYSGGGIMLSDNAASWVKAYGNQVVSTTNYGIAISAGNNNEFYGNRIVSSGMLPDGRYIAAQNVGAYIWDHNDDPTFGNNIGHDNVIGWMRFAQRNDWWTPDAAAWYGNVRMSGPITLATEAAEFTQWLNKLSAAGVTVGP